MITEDQWRDIERLPKAHQEDVLNFLMGHAAHTPSQPIPGKLKKLKGEYSDVWQYSISRELRPHYTIDEVAKQVNVERVGHHPSWGRGSSGGRNIRS